MRGRFITLEGCDGCGKSTQIALLKDDLTKRGVPFAFTREPGGTQISERIRDIIADPSLKEMDRYTELFLYAAARRQHVVRFIAAELGRGKLVVCDRFSDSTTAYQGYGRGIDKSVIDFLDKVALGDVKIDLTLLFDLSPEEAFLRKGGADKNDRLESEAPDFYRKVYDGYKKIAASSPERIEVIDAHGSADEIHRRVMDTLVRRGII